MSRCARKHRAGQRRRATPPPRCRALLRSPSWAVSRHSAAQRTPAGAENPTLTLGVEDKCVLQGLASYGATGSWGADGLEALRTFGRIHSSAPVSPADPGVRVQVPAAEGHRSVGPRGWGRRPRRESRLPADPQAMVPASHPGPHNHQHDHHDGAPLPSPEPASRRASVRA